MPAPRKSDVVADDRIDGFGTAKDLVWTPVQMAEVEQRLDNRENPFLRRGLISLVAGVLAAVAYRLTHHRVRPG